MALETARYGIETVIVQPGAWAPFVCSEDARMMQRSPRVTSDHSSARSRPFESCLDDFFEFITLAFPFCRGTERAEMVEAARCRDVAVRPYQVTSVTFADAALAGREKLRRKIMRPLLSNPIGLRLPT
jgi:hypothetical protein